MPNISRSRTAPPAWCLAAAVALLATAPALPLAAQDPIFSDDFESANTLAWDARVGIELPAADAYRYSDLDLRDPHLFVDTIVFGCNDFTDNDLPLGLAPSVNSQIATLITNDGDGDGLLDLSALLLFRPYDAAAGGGRLDQAGGACTAPLAGTNCALDGLSVPRTTSYDALGAGTCLAALAGTTSGYLPAVPAPAGPCFVSAPITAQLGLLGVAVPLSEVQVAAEALSGAPPAGFQAGLLRGFLRESDADLLLLPPELPLVGGQPVSVLLPGGSGNCAAGDDRDLLAGESGWWFYFELTADEAAYTGP
jgi:hypothetical protein